MTDTETLTILHRLRDKVIFHRHERDTFRGVDTEKEKYHAHHIRAFEVAIYIVETETEGE